MHMHPSYMHACCCLLTSIYALRLLSRKPFGAADLMLLTNRFVCKLLHAQCSCHGGRARVVVHTVCLQWIAVEQSFSCLHCTKDAQLQYHMFVLAGDLAVLCVLSPRGHTGRAFTPQQLQKAITIIEGFWIFCRT